MKYFVLGGFSSAFFLYGIALIYGATGSTNLVDDRQLPRRPTSLADDGLLLAGFALLLVGFGVQGRRGAVPLLDARRLPGLAEPGRRVHGLGREGRRLRRAAARVRPRPSASYRRRLAADRLRPRRPHPAGRVRCWPSCRPT